MSRGREVMVGAVILLALAVGFIGTLWLQGTNWGSPETPIEVLLGDVAQLSAGNPVKFRGVSIGQVTRIDVEPAGQAVRVSMRIDAEVIIPDDAVVVMAPESFFGDWQAEIVQRGRYPSFAFFDVPAAELARDTLVLGGFALPEMSRLTASAQEISNNLAQLSQRLEIAFNDTTAGNMARAIGNIEAVTGDLRAFVETESNNASNLSATADSALREIQEASRIARMSFARIESLLGDARMDSIMTNVARATGSIQTITGDLEGSTDDFVRTMARADSAFARIDQITARVAAGEGAIGRLLVDSTLAVRAEDVLLQLDLLLQDLRENPRRYVRLSIF